MEGEKLADFRCVAQYGGVESRTQISDPRVGVLRHKPQESISEVQEGLRSQVVYPGRSVRPQPLQTVLLDHHPVVFRMTSTVDDA